MPNVPIKNPDLSSEEHSYLTLAGTASTTNITVADYEGFSDNDYLVIGPYGKERTEILKIDDASIDATITLDSSYYPAYAHPANTVVTKTPWNIYSLESGSTETGSFSVLGTAELEVDDEYSYYNDTSGTSTDWYKVRFYNSETATYSDYSDAVQAIGYKANSRGRLKEMVKSLFGDKYGKWVDDSDLDNFFYQVENEVFNYRKRWSFLQAETTFDLLPGKHSYDLSTYISDIKAPEKKYLENVWIGDNDPLVYQDRKEFDQLMEGAQYTTMRVALTGADTTAYVIDGTRLDTSGSAYIEGDLIEFTGLSGTVMSGVTGGTIHSVGEEIWMKAELDLPSDYAVWAGNLKMNPCADTAYVCNVVYYKGGVEMSEDNAVSEIPWATSLLLNGVLSYCYQTKEDEAGAQRKRAEFENELRERSFAERLGQKQSLVPSEREGYIRDLDYTDFDKGGLKWIRDRYRT